MLSPTWVFNEIYQYYSRIMNTFPHEVKRSVFYVRSCFHEGINGGYFNDFLLIFAMLVILPLICLMKSKNLCFTILPYVFARNSRNISDTCKKSIIWELELFFAYYSILTSIDHVIFSSGLSF